MLKKLFIGLLIAIIIGAGFVSYLLYQKLNVTKSKAIKAIPENASLIIESNDFSLVWNKLTNSTAYWRTLSGVNFVVELNTNTKFLDSLFSAEGKIAQLVKTIAGLARRSVE